MCVRRRGGMWDPVTEVLRPREWTNAWPSEGMGPRGRGGAGVFFFFGGGGGGAGGGGGGGAGACQNEVDFGSSCFIDEKVYTYIQSRCGPCVCVLLCARVAKVCVRVCVCVYLVVGGG